MSGGLVGLVAVEVFIGVQTVGLVLLTRRRDRRRNRG